ncbi:MAG: EamA/RhaT family transporter [Alphaproteobacteria bacterium]|nr:EamA/RhaT family transporter [Alphaproteobacteria bacterium]
MRLHHLALAVLVNLVFGFNFVAGKIGADHFEPLFFIALRFAVVVTCLAPFLKDVPGRWRDVVMVGLLIGVAHFGLMFIGMRLSAGAASVALIAQLHVPFSIILAMIFLKERLNARRLAGTALAFTGVAVIGFDPTVFAHLEALPFVVLGALAIGLGVVLIPGTRGVPIVTLQAWMGVISIPPLLLLSFVFESGQAAAIATATFEQWGALLFVAVGATVIGHGSWYYLLKAYPITVISPFTLLGPVFGVVSGVLFLDDTLTWEILVGGAMVLIGIGLIQIRAGAGVGHAAAAVKT